jgi:aminoglycoside 6'-N-acetyltransferase I
MRSVLYSSLSDEFHKEEMEKIFNSSEWYCQFIEDKNNYVLGFIELSSRNVVDGCLSSPVAYLEGLYLKSEFRGKGLGKKIINIIINWCREKGFSELATDTELNNSEAQEFFQAVGFQETYRIVEFRIEVNKK